jgi:nitroreductase
MDVVEAIYGRRSIRSYAQRPVERDLIEAIILDAAQAPPPTRTATQSKGTGFLFLRRKVASGVVPWTFNVILGIERIAALGMMAMTHAKAYHRADEPGWSWLGRSGFKIFWDAPVLVVISGPIEDCCWLTAAIKGGKKQDDFLILGADKGSPAKPIKKTTKIGKAGKQTERLTNPRDRPGPPARRRPASKAFPALLSAIA